MDPTTHRVIALVEVGAWDEVKLLLHPYLHWTDSARHTMRGRTKVLEMLKARGHLDEPSRVELKDQQIYRWWEA